MPLSPEDVERQTFKERFKGYDVDEVDAFLDRVVARLQELQRERDELVRRLEAAEHTSEESERLLQRTLVTAQRTADETVEEARAESERLVAEAREEAERVRTEAQAEADRLLAEARDEVVREREHHQAEAEQLARVVDELREFRDRYIERVRGAIHDQLEQLDRVGWLPDVPSEIQDLAASVPESDLHHPHVPPVITMPGEEVVGHSVLDADPEQPDEGSRDDA